ncbi:hypothetical protein OG625_13890 [Streptomyces sp. NBC_01351]|uniref:hypothetical protein n=1 Tax=Streptomyces sp. NBC_01351 TaxID=2903833 RepID=UPI002E3146AE|nr:hypothetical protein [Streptomyces sp. NBC_01351]
MTRYTRMGAVLLIGGLFVGGAAWIGVSLADGMEAELDGPAAVASASPSQRTVGDDLSEQDRAGLGQKIAALQGDGKATVTAYTPVWVDKDMRLAKIPVVLTNSGTTPQRIETRLTVRSSPDGATATLWEGTVDSGGEVAPGKSVVTSVSVQSVRDVTKLRADLRGAGGDV